MGMTEEAFFAQSIILWRYRINGFLEMHGGGKSADEGMSKSDLERLMAEHPD